MYATEFQTIINEPYIKIPNYEAFKGHNVRVVLLDIDNKNNDIELVDNLEKKDILNTLSQISKEDNEIDSLATTIVEI